MTSAIKNNYGILPGAQKATLHCLAGGPKRFNEVIVDVFNLRPPDLFIVDADTCITCFCCQEICTEKAITLQ